MYPGISVILQDTLAGLIQPKVRDGEVDFDIGTFERTGRELVAEPFMADTLVLACPSGHPLANKSSVAWRELAGHPFISLTRDNSVGQLIRTCLADTGVEVQSAYEVSYLSTWWAWWTPALALRCCLPTRARSLRQKAREAGDPARDVLHYPPR